MDEKGKANPERQETTPLGAASHPEQDAAPLRRHLGLRRNPSSIVDTTDDPDPRLERGRRHASIVDTTERDRTRPDASSIVDTASDDDGEYDEEDEDFSEDVLDGIDDDDETDDEVVEPIDAAPIDDQSIPVPVRLKGPTEAKFTGPSGPDGELTRQLRDAHKEKVASRARSRGVDPGAGSVPSTNGTTRSEKTHNHYLERGRMLVQRYRRERDLGSTSIDGLDPVEFVNWLFSLKPTLSRATWRPYRQAAKAILTSVPHDDTETAIAMIDADIAEASAASEKDHAPEAERERPATRKDGIPRRTSGLKEKRFLKKDFDRVLAYLRYYSRSKFAPILGDWMAAGITTGLRPIEWRATDIEVKEDPAAPRGRWVWLYVLNAKHTNGRGNGLVRTIDISHFSDGTIDSIRRMSQRGAQWLIDGVYDSMQSQSSQLLYAVCEKLFSTRNKTYALYSLRHQFVANAKSIHRPEEVSALLGHVVTDTAAENYGRKTSSWGPEEITDRAEPVPEEVATVRQRLIFFQERVTLQQAAGLIKEGKNG
jgi:hypothetical protein